MNLRRGVKAPRSGSIEENGKTAAEQIGETDLCGYLGAHLPRRPGARCGISPPQPRAYRTAAAAWTARGLMAAGVAAAYTASSLDEVLDAGLRFLPEKCDYRRVVETVRAYHRAHPAEADFRACREMIAREFSDDEYPGGYHIVPNAGISHPCHALRQGRAWPQHRDLRHVRLRYRLQREQHRHDPQVRSAVSAAYRSAIAVRSTIL